MRPSGAVFKRLLVPVDLSEKSSAAVDIACRLAAGNHGEVILLHVIETIEHLEFDELRSFYTKLEKNAATRLRSLADQAAHEDISIQVETVYGKRAASIIEFAAKRRVDVIVLNSHRVQPGSGIASLSYQVAVLAACPVLLLK
jgi:nucleotide-binding universal stress UspA family protein